jgi:polar amino acid transport system permease protein
MWGHYTQQLIHSLPFFLKGFWMTIAVSLLSLIGGTVIGFFAGVGRASRAKWLRRLLSVYVDAIRGTPFLVQLFILFFILPELGVQIKAFPAAVLGLTICSGSYICEIFASGIEAVPWGQREAAISTGLNRYQQLRFVVLPQAMRTILPPLVGQYVLLIKDSSVVSVIGVLDVTRAGWLTVQRIPEGILVFGLVGIFYFIICYPLIHLVNYLEARMTVQKFRL